MGLKRYFRKKRLWKRFKMAFDECIYELINEVIEDVREFDYVYGTQKLYKYLERMIRKSQHDPDRNNLNPTIVRLLPTNPQLVTKIHDATDYREDFPKKEESKSEEESFKPSGRQLESIAEKRQRILDRKEFVKYSLNNKRKKIGRMG